MTAVASFLQARTNGGTWRIRIDDLDQQRCRDEHTTTILNQLAGHGLEWDHPIYRQSAHLDDYRAALAEISTQAHLYRCTCSRATLASTCRIGIDGPVYPGTCQRTEQGGKNGAIRIKLEQKQLQLNDPWLGMISRDTTRDVGDFVLVRADGTIGYQLACIVDELTLGVTEVVRGSDLVGSSVRQLHLLRDVLGRTAPRYCHIPVLTSADGRKLSKQNHAPAIDSAMASQNLTSCLRLLGQLTPDDLQHQPVAETLRWALTHWDPARIPRQTLLPSAA